MQAAIESQLLQLTQQFLTELHTERATQAISITAFFDRDLGLDSLSKVELFRRIENHFGIKLPEKALAEINNLQELVQVIQQNKNMIVESAQFFKPMKSLPAATLDLSNAKTLYEAFTLYGMQAPERPHIYFQNELGHETIIRYGLLYQEAIKVAAGLQQRGIQLGDTVAIMQPTSPEFFYAFCGTILAGAIPVPIYPPFRPNQIEEYIKREAKILLNAEVRVLITFAEAALLSKLLRQFIPSLSYVMTVKELQTDAEFYKPVTVETNDGALIQYTSGSTGDPKGVYLTQGNMLANIRAIGAAAPIKPTDVSVSWLPLYHDMGLMTWLASYYYGLPLTIMSPLTFLSRPEKWLWAIHYHRATMSGGPNFAYELCVKKINPRDIEGLDLSSWRFAFNGAEAINPKTLERFSKTFAPYGFKPEMFAPVYGLAESTVALTFPKNIRPPLIDRVLRDCFQSEGKAIPAPIQDKHNILEFVACGQPIPLHDIRIVDETGQVCPERVVGQLQFTGPSSMQGYYRNPEATQKIYHDGWWDTGDLAYIADQDIFITGRKKDVIIKAGKNIHPEEIEEIVGQVKGIRQGCVIAFGVPDALTGTEKLIVVAETYAKSPLELQSIQSTIFEKMSLALDITPDNIVLGDIKTIPKTSSGKLQRSLCKELYLSGKLSKKKQTAFLQMLKLGTQSIFKGGTRFFSYLLKGLYGLYIGLLLILTIPLLLLFMLVLPQKSAGVVLKIWAKIFIGLTGCRIKVTGLKHIADKANIIFVSNHASYFDAALLASILPANIMFTPKQELVNNPLLRFIIKKLDYSTIDRLDFSKSIENTNTIIKKVKEGRSIVFFPEGTFSYATGLRPFKMGAFNIAVETKRPICPVAIAGTRKILRGDSLLPKPGRIEVHIGEIIYPEKWDWSETVRLQSLSRKEILSYCGEPSIDVIGAGISER